MQQYEYVGALQYYIKVAVHVGGEGGSGCLLAGR